MPKLDLKSPGFVGALGGVSQAIIDTLVVAGGGGGSGGAASVGICGRGGGGGGGVMEIEDQELFIQQYPVTVGGGGGGGGGANSPGGTGGTSILVTDTQQISILGGVSGAAVSITNQNQTNENNFSNAYYSESNGGLIPGYYVTRIKLRIAAGATTFVVINASTGVVLAQVSIGATGSADWYTLPTPILITGGLTLNIAWMGGGGAARPFGFASPGAGSQIQRDSSNNGPYPTITSPVIGDFLTCTGCSAGWEIEMESRIISTGGGGGQVAGAGGAAGGGGAGGGGTGGCPGSNGGTGEQNDFRTGSDVFYSGGGGGGTSSASNPGGAGGGGTGTNGHVPGGAGGGNTGGGGGGTNLTGNGGSGGSGIVVIRYLTGTMTATGGTETSYGSFSVHTFTSSGTFEVTSIP